MREEEQVVVLLPCDEGGEAEEVVILRMKHLVKTAKHMRILQVVFENFKERFSEEFNFVD